VTRGATQHLDTTHSLNENCGMSARGSLWLYARELAAGSTVRSGVAVRETQGCAGFWRRRSGPAGSRGTVAKGQFRSFSASR
jgi:hypothetical protein